MKISLISMLGLLFITLKLTNVITWSWVWVLAPFWGQLVIVALVLAPILAFPNTRRGFMRGLLKGLDERYNLTNAP